MDLSELSESAKLRGLPILAALVAQPALQPHLAQPAAPDALLDPPRSKNLVSILEMLARRGLDPDGMTWMLPQLDALERSLVVWDVLTGSLLKTEELDAFRELAADVAAHIGKAGRRGCGDQLVRDLAPRFGDTTSSTGALLEGAAHGRLASIVELRSRGPELALRARAELDAIRARARLLARAHLPTLASLHLGLLWHVFDDRDALLDWIDVLADADRFDVLPAIDKLDDAARAYVRYRVAFAADEPVAAIEAVRLLQNVDGPRAAAVRVDAAIRTRRPDEASRRSLAAGAGASDCRFVARVDTLARIFAGEPIVGSLDRFLGRFGNDFELWGELSAEPDRVADLPASCESIIARELQWFSHEPAVWRALALMVGEPISSSALAEVDARLTAQSTWS